MQKEQIKILYLYLNPVEGTYNKIVAGELPSNHLYGFVELTKLGYNVTYKDSQPRGAFSKIISHLNKRYGFCLKDFNTLHDFSNYDIIVVKGPFSTSATIASRILRKKIVYLDPILRQPRNYFRKLIFGINLKLAHGSVVFSRSQYELIQRTYKIKDSKLKLIPFCLDTSFFKPVQDAKQYSKPFILSVGMDLGRDYATLIEAINKVGVDLKIVSLPYLLNGLTLNQERIQIFNNIPYKQLFELYAESKFVVIPIKKWAAQYSSGTTSLLEAKLLGKAVIATSSEPLKEYLEDGNGVYYVEAENISSLCQAISKLLHDPALCASIAHKGKDDISLKYNTYIFAEIFGKYLTALV